MSKFNSFLQRKGVDMTWKTYFVDALGAMALGLFASLLIGTIFQTLGDKTGIEAFLVVAKYAKAATGAAIAVAIAFKLGCEGLVLFSAIAVGIAGNELGGPMGAYVAVIIAIELGKMVYKETQIDILVTPAVVIISGVLMAYAVGAPIQKVMLGTFIENATQMQPFIMGIVVSVVIGAVLTLPISSAAICLAIGLDGIAGGAATAGCCAQMIGFAVLSFRENRWGGLVAQGLGTSMLQMGNIVKNPNSSTAYLSHHGAYFDLCLPSGEHPHRFRHGYLWPCRTHRHLYSYARRRCQHVAWHGSGLLCAPCRAYMAFRYDSEENRMD